MKNIGILLPTINSGGAERAATRISKILNGTYNVYLILFEDTYMKYNYAGTLINMNIPAKNGIFSKVFSFFRRCRRMKKIKKENKLDAVISFLQGPNFVNILSDFKNCKTVISVRNYILKEKQQGFINKMSDFLIKILYRKAEIIISVSEEIKKSLIENYKLDANKIKVIYNPYDIAEIEKHSEEELDSFTDFFNDGNIFISVGRIMYQKGFWHLIKAFKLVSEKESDAKLAIIGVDYMQGKCQKLADELGLKDRVLFAGYQNNPFKFIKRSSAYVLSSLYEGFPNSLAEAMSCKKPVIAVDCKSGPREILFKELDLNRQVNGVIYADYGILTLPLEEDEDFSLSFTKGEEILGEAMLQVISDKKINEEYSLKAWQRANDFNYGVCKDKFIKLIEG